MPEEGIQLSPSKDILTSAEIYYLCSLFVDQGVKKIRLTGGEPTVRKDIVPLMQKIGSLRSNGLKELALTTNGISLHRKLEQMVEAGLTGVNISLDTLDPFQFQLLTRRQGFDAVMKSIKRVQELNKLGAGVKLKINCVVMRGLNDHQILPFVDMTQDEDMEVRFIEYMPFDGNKWSQKKMVPYNEMLDIIRTKYPGLTRLRDARNDTSKTWQIPGFKGRVGFITSMTHNFCGTCNRLRITSDGNLKVCLHGNAEVSLRDLLREHHQGEPMNEAAFEAIRKVELERRKRGNGSLDGEGTWMSKEQQLLEVIGAAVKRKKAKHAGMGELENMKNRPMILIGNPQTLHSTPSAFSLLGVNTSFPRVPVHMLMSQTLGVSNVRLYSSESGDSPSWNAESSSNVQSSGLAPSIGFQSLSSLFEEPIRRRYSRPDTMTEDQVGSRAENVEMPAKGNKPTALPDDRSPHSSSSHPKVLLSPVNEIKNDHQLQSKASLSDSSGKNHRPPNMTEIPIRHMPPRTRVINYQPVFESNHHKRSNVFISSENSKASPEKQESGAWGLGNEEPWTMDLKEDSETTLTQKEGVEIGVISSPKSQESSQTGAFSKDEAPSERLTHVTPAGEAHMVNVGSKPTVKRVAIAYGIVQFTVPEPLKLIVENANKKGDVLGVARIAGIMAAKRASDIIPLCHPILISKVELEVKPLPPGTRFWGSSRPPNKFGCVTLQATVETVGPTGVEMEALMAVTGAALTVYDMCKAVDRKMTIHRTELVYKSGGRSGLFVNGGWLRAQQLREDWFAERGLQCPTREYFSRQK